jgi:hypothetical protein
MNRKNFYTFFVIFFIYMFTIVVCQREKVFEKILYGGLNSREYWQGQFDRAKLALQDALIGFLPFCNFGENKVKNYFIFDLFTKF